MDPARNSKPNPARSRSQPANQRDTGFFSASPKQTETSAPNFEWGDSFFQPKLDQLPTLDPLEAEADRAADQIVSQPRGEPPVQRQSDPTEQEETRQEKTLAEEITSSEGNKISESGPQRKPAFYSASEQDANAFLDTGLQLKMADAIVSLPDKQVQREEEEVVSPDQTEGNPPSRDLPEQLQATKGKGHPLDGGTRNAMESGFGTDFSQVRIHTGSDAVNLNRDLGAQAFTYGEDIYFDEGKYQPGTQSGDHLLAHELTHTIQQGAVSGKTVQKKAQAPAVKQIPQDIVPLDVPFQPTAALAAYIEQERRGAEVRVKYKHLASGTIKVKKRRDGTYDSKGKGYPLLPLHLPWFSPLQALGIHSYLAVRIRKNEVTGYADFAKKAATVGWGGSAKNRLKPFLKKHKDALGWVGMDKLSLPALENSLQGGKLLMGMRGIKVRLGGYVNGQFDFLTEDDHLTIVGSGEVNIPKLKPTTVDFKRDAKGNISGKGSIGVEVKNFTGNVQVEFLNGLVDVKGDVGYRTEKLSGTIHLLVTDAKKARQVALQQLPPDKINQEALKASGVQDPKPGIQPGPRAIAGWGTLDFAFNEWIVGKALVVVDNEGHVTVQGEIAPPAMVTLFPAKPFGPYTIINIKPTFRWGIPYIADVHVGLEIHLYAEAGVGPALLKNIKASGTYSTDPAIFNDFRLEGTLSMQASAALALAFGAKVGTSILGFDIDGKATITGKLGIRGYLEANPVIGYREKAAPNQGKKGEFFLQGSAELAAQPFLGLSGKFGVYIDSPWPVPNKNWVWPLFDKEYPLPGEFGIGLTMQEYILGSGKWPQVEWGKAKFDRDKFMDDVIEKRVPKKKSGQAAPRKEFKDNLKGQKPVPPPTMTFASDQTGGGKSDKKKALKGIPEPKLRENWIKGMQALKKLKEQAAAKPLGQDELRKKLAALQKRYKFQALKVQPQSGVWVVTAMMNKQLHNRNNPMGIKVEQTPSGSDPNAQAEVDKAIKSIPSKEKSKLQNGKISRGAAVEVAKQIKKEFPVFKVFEVMDGNDSWDYYYVASPGKVYGDDEARPGKLEAGFDVKAKDLVMDVTNENYFEVKSVNLDTMQVSLVPLNSKAYAVTLNVSSLQANLSSKKWAKIVAGGSVPVKKGDAIKAPFEHGTKPVYIAYVEDTNYSGLIRYKFRGQNGIHAKPIKTFATMLSQGQVIRLQANKDFLRKNTPSPALQAWAQARLSATAPDPAFPSLTVDGTAQADHIFAVDKIMNLPNFDLLSPEQQLEVLNLKTNFVALSPRANASKGSKSFREWRKHEALGLAVDPAFRRKMMREEIAAQKAIIKKIENFVKAATPK